MYKSPLILGADSLGLTTGRARLAGLFGLVGDNTGNIVFSEAVFHCIQGGHRSYYDFSDFALEGRDAIVIAAANWINGYGEATDFLRRIERTRLPICVIGLGAQSQDDRTIPKMKPSQERLIRVLADRSNSIGVRGTYSAEVLDAYGIKNVEVTGCPSMLLMGETASIRGKPDSLDRISVFGTRYMFSPGYPEQEQIFAAAYREGFDLVLQSELAEMYFATQRFDDEENVLRADSALQSLYPDQSPPAIKAFLRQRAKVFFFLDDWLAYAAGRDFMLGSRIHGVVASLLAGTRSLLVTHDARTRELAATLSLPQMPISELRMRTRKEVEALIDRADPSALIRNYPAYRARFRDFLHRNGLSLTSVKASRSLPQLEGRGRASYHPIALKRGVNTMQSQVREKLTIPRTFYVRSDGSDENYGLDDTPAGAFRSWQYAAFFASLFDFNGNTVTLQAGDEPGLVTFKHNVTFNPMFGGGTLLIRGNGPKRTLWDSDTGDTWTANNTGSVQITFENASVGSAGNGIKINYGSLCNIGSDIEFRDFGGHAIWVHDNKAICQILNSKIAISGKMKSFLFVQYGHCFFEGAQISGEPGAEFSLGCVTMYPRGSAQVIENKVIGQFVGKRYNISHLSLLNFSGADPATQLPGDEQGFADSTSVVC
jgi:polysaccharide pyruvyl transferase WcaK-like protein